jgi:hypothetical protein
LDMLLESRGGRTEMRDRDKERLLRHRLPMHVAIYSGWWHAVERLLPRMVGYPAVAPDERGCVPLFVLASAHFPPGVNEEALRRYTAALALPSGEICDHFQRGVGHYAAMATEGALGYPTGTDATLLVLGDAIDPNKSDALGRTPLHVAAALGNAKAVQWLLSKKAEPTRLDAFGNMAVHLAAQGGHRDVVEILRTSMRPTEAVAANGIGLTVENSIDRFAPAKVRQPRPQRHYSVGALCVGVLSGLAVALVIAWAMLG